MTHRSVRRATIVAFVVALLLCPFLCGCAPFKGIHKGTTVLVVSTEPIQAQPTTSAWDVLKGVTDVPRDVVKEIVWPMTATEFIRHAATHRASGFVFTSRPTGDAQHRFTITVSAGQQVQFVAEPIQEEK